MAGASPLATLESSVDACFAFHGCRHGLHPGCWCDCPHCLLGRNDHLCPRNARLSPADDAKRCLLALRCLLAVCLLFACLLAACTELPAACCPPLLAACLLLALRCLCGLRCCCHLMLAAACSLAAFAARSRSLLGRSQRPSAAPLCLWVLPNLWIFYPPACFLIRRRP